MKPLEKLWWRLKQKLAREIGSPLDFLRVWLLMAGVRLGLWKTGCEGLELSVVTCVRNRCGLREENCLASLMRQSLPRSCYEVIVVDYGSREPGRVKEMVKAAGPGARYVFVDAKGEFNNPRAKNLGLQVAKGKKVVFTNFDIVFEKNALEAALLALRNSPRIFVEIRRFDLPEELIEGADLVNAYEAATRLPGVSLNQTASDVQAIDAEEMRRTFNGFDEAFEGWGGWDTDLRLRAVNAGFRCLNLFPLASVIHEGHQSLGEVHGLHYRKNRDYLESKPLNAVKANP